LVKVIIKKNYDIRDIYQRMGFGGDNYIGKQIFDKVTNAIIKEVELRDLPYSVIVNNSGSPVLEFRNEKTGEVIAREEEETEEIKRLLNELENVLKVAL
jgi:hypothetical protein